MTIGATGMGASMYCRVVGTHLVWHCDADGATLLLGAEQPLFSPWVRDFVEAHAHHDPPRDWRDIARFEALAPSR